jgi:predicted dehydrogenase
VPVLCEKPIAADYAEAAATVALAAELGVPFVIAENYRRWPFVRRLRRLIEAGAIGDLATIHIFFGREAYYPKAYLLAMPCPLLQDVAVHHLDLLRYLSGQEGLRVSAQHYRPVGSPYPGRAASLLHIELSGGLHAAYDGSLSAKYAPTTWAGNWRIEGSAGVLELKNDRIYLTQGTDTRAVEDLSDAPQTHEVLDEFLLALAEGREPETSGRDYLKTQRLVDLALNHSASST